MRDAVVMLVDGRMLAYTDLGEPAGPVAMYFHGAPTSRLDLVWHEDHSQGVGGLATDLTFQGLPGQGHVSLIHEIPQLCADLLAPSKGPAR